MEQKIQTFKKTIKFSDVFKDNTDYKHKKYPNKNFVFKKHKDGNVIFDDVIECFRKQLDNSSLEKSIGNNFDIIQHIKDFLKDVAVKEFKKGRCNIEYIKSVSFQPITINKDIKENRKNILSKILSKIFTYQSPVWDVAEILIEYTILDDKIYKRKPKKRKSIEYLLKRFI